MENNLSFYLGEIVQIPITIENISKPVIFDNLPTWLSYNEELQIITGKPDAPGTFNFNIIAINGDERVEELISFKVVWPITEALNDLNWEAFGDAIWFPQSEVRFDELSLIHI